METKYTTDGKKVAVIGNLNAQEKIVQEIFVTANGQEIPSGENFVVKSLHDEPVKSWQQYRIEKIKQQLNEIEAKLETYKKTFEIDSKRLAHKIRAINALEKNLKEHQFQTLIDVICGNIKYIVTYYGNFRGIGLCQYDDLIDDVGIYSFNGLKLVSVFGKSDGNLLYRIHDYNDGSGGTRQIYPHSSFHSAVSHVRELLIDKDVFLEEDYALIEKYNIVLPEETLERQRLLQVEKNEREKARIANEIASLQEKLNKL